MTMKSDAGDELHHAIQQLVVANRILAHEGVLDAFGHVSVRHPTRPDRYLLACSRSPEQVTEEDILEFDLESHPIDDRGLTLYSERPIHGCIYQARPDVRAVCHNHAHSLLPFAVTGVRLRPVFHVGAAIGNDVPTWEIRDDFGDSTNLLVTDNDRGRSLAKALAAGPTCLMRGHGSVVASRDLRSVVFIAVTLMQNAAILTESLKMGAVNYLSEGEVEQMGQRNLAPRSLNRAWDYWCERAGYSTRVATRGADA